MLDMILQRHFAAASWFSEAVFDQAGLAPQQARRIRKLGMRIGNQASEIPAFDHSCPPPRKILPLRQEELCVFLAGDDW